MNPWRRLSRAAFIALTLHLVAGLAMALVLRRGLETNADLLDRLRFLAEHAGLWRVAWLAWNAAALSIIYFYVAFARAHAGNGAPMRVAVLLGAAGVVTDLCAEAIEMFALPALAAGALAGRGALSLFFSTHRLAVLLTGFLANGLYTVAAVVLCWAARRVYPRWTLAAGMGVGASGAWLSAAALLDSTAGMIWSNAVLIPCLALWQAGVAAAASVRARDTAPPPAGTRPLVVYDGACGICAGNLPWLHRLDWLGFFDDLPYQSEEVYRLFPHLRRSACEQALQLAFPDGRVHAGADAFREVFLRMPATLPAGLLMAIPPLPWLLRRLYPLLARNRYRLGGHCPVDPARPRKASGRPE
ncbi:MAG: thiol-disulfide oxidoreductase DCC family protein [Candidatus Polarisedimenticolia bacterium]